MRYLSQRISKGVILAYASPLSTLGFHQATSIQRPGIRTPGQPQDLSLSLHKSEWYSGSGENLRKVPVYSFNTATSGRRWQRGVDDLVIKSHREILDSTAYFNCLCRCLGLPSQMLRHGAMCIPCSECNYRQPYLEGSGFNSEGDLE